ncbi:MAG: hypothetical protein HY007_04215 [Candidatus Sungbacteria bacterium]|nr:hypothetical protein [Candidatus Sungbacteria bacterium]
MEQEILKKLEEQAHKLDELSASLGRIRKYFFWILIGSIAMIVLPLVGLGFVIPQFLNIYRSMGAM